VIDTGFSMSVKEASKADKTVGGSIDGSTKAACLDSDHGWHYCI